MKYQSFRDITLYEDSYLGSKQKLNREVTIDAVYNRFYDTGRFSAFNCEWREGMPNKPHFFWDSDVAKWIEGASNSLVFHPDKELERKIDDVVDAIEKNRDKNGYFNIYFLNIAPTERFKNRTDHELYCLGHLIEGAIAYYNATGKEKLLRLMEDYTNYVYKVFVEEGSASFMSPGHEEIELALMRLYRTTGNKKYLELCGFFLDKRGANGKDVEYDVYARDGRGSQSHLPVREQTTAEGHAVRACYLYTAMADYAAETGDEKMKAACKAIFRDMVDKKMYITGSAGATHLGECFTVAYDLPNSTAYAETCAAISIMFFANKMLGLEIDSEYADIVERALYNGVLSGISLDGKHFFYENPLEINLTQFGRHTAWSQPEHYPITERVEVFGCSCCPPNLNRVLSSLGDYIYGTEGDTLYVHQYISSKLNSDVEAEIKTDYPRSGDVVVNAKGVEKIAVRIPWFSPEIKANKPYTVEKGYAVFENDGTDIKVTFDMTPRFYEASSNVWENGGKVALMRGPVVMCIENVDNPVNLFSVCVDTDTTFEVEDNGEFGLPTVTVKGAVRLPTEKLYSRVGGERFEETTLKYIPYSAFANRGRSDMRVWVNKK